MRGIKKKLIKAFEEIRSRSKNRLYPFVVFNLGLAFLQFIYIRLRYQFLNPEIPLWLTKMWGNYQLAQRRDIYVFPALVAAITLMSVVFILFANKYFVRYASEAISLFVTFSNVLLSWQLVTIVLRASVPFEPLIRTTFLALFPPFILAFLAVYLVLPRFIEMSHKKGLVTNPQLHDHPAMILRQPSARGGGLVYTVVFVLLSAIFLGTPVKLLGIYVSVILLAVLGFVDDFQNTHPRSDFKLLENPVLRLVLLFSIVATLVVSGVRIESLTNPLGGVVSFSKIWVPSVLTVLWVVWVLNVLSWSNGIDGQYAGIVGISSVIIAFLALRFVPLEPIHKQVAVMAAISAGAALGFVKYTWSPSKIMWGFGAMCAGLVLSSLSILVQGKIVTSVLIILIPFLDAIVTVGRRLLQRKNPFLGDRGHLHHLLMERGWSMPKIALFYWLTTMVFGLIGLFSSEQYLFQIVLLLSGVVAFFIVLMNLRSIKEKHRQ